MSDDARINNGRRLDARFGSFSGQVGALDRDGVTRIAFFADIRKLKAGGVGPGSVGDLGGEPCSVVEMAPSDHVQGMVVLTVQPAPAEEA